MYSILTIWKERNNISFDDEKNSIHRLKHSFLCNIWTWSKLFLVFSPPSVVDFVDLVGLVVRRALFFVAPLFWRCIEAVVVYAVYFGALCMHLLFMIFPGFTHQIYILKANFIIFDNSQSLSFECLFSFDVVSSHPYLERFFHTS